MMPADSKSTVAVLSGLLDVDVKLVSTVRDFEDGGVALNDTSQGTMGYEWVCSVNQEKVTLQREGAASILAFELPGIVEISFAFDQNMRPAFAYRLADENLYLRWFDSSISAYRTDNFGLGRNPRLAMDDKRASRSASSDIIFGYIRGDSLYYRQQRDRYGVERLLRSGIDKITKLKNIGMTHNLRLLFELV